MDISHLPMELLLALPEQINPDHITAHLVLRQSLTGTFGETHLFAVHDKYTVVTRESVLDSFFFLSFSAPATISKEGLTTYLVLPASKHTYKLPISLAERFHVERFLQTSPTPLLWIDKHDESVVPFPDPQSVEVELEEPRWNLHQIGTTAYSRWGSDLRTNTITHLSTLESGDSFLLLGACRAAGLRLWSEHQETRRFETSTLVHAMTGSGQTVAAICAATSKDAKPTLHVWSTLENTEPATMHVLKDTSLAINPSRDQIVLASKHEIQWHTPRDLELVEIITLEEGTKITCVCTKNTSAGTFCGTAQGHIHALDETSRTQTLLHTKTEPITHITVDAQDRYLAALSQGTLSVIRVEDGVQSLTYTLGKDEPIENIAWLGGERAHQIALCGASRVRILDVETRNIVEEWRFSENITALTTREDTIFAAGVSVHARRINHGPRFEASRFKSTVREVFFSSSTPEQLVACSNDGRILRADQQGIITQREHPDAELAIPSHQGLMVALAQGRKIVLKDDQDLELRTYDGPRSEIRSMAFSRNDVLLGVLSRAGQVHLWETAGFADYTLQAEEQVRHSAFALSRRGDLCIVGGRNGALRMFSLQQGQSRLMWSAAQMHERAVLSLAFSRDDRFVVSSDLDGDVWLWSSAQGTVHAKWNNPAGKVYALAIDPDQRWVAVGGEQGRLVVWDIEQGHMLVDEKLHDLSITALAVDRQGEHLLTGSSDMTARLWNIQELFETQPA